MTLKKFTILLFLLTSILAIIDCILPIKQINDPKLFKLSFKLDEISSNVHNINQGGCGFFALYLSDYFDREKIPYEIIYVRDNENEENQYYIPNHIILKLKKSKIFVDSRGFFNKSYIYLYGTYLSIHSKEELKEILKVKGWNSDFDRNDTTKIKLVLCQD